MASDPDTFRVSPSLQGLPGVNSPPVESDAPGMLVRAGQSVTRAGTAGAQVALDVLREQNATRVSESLLQLTEYQQELTYGPNGDGSGWAGQFGKNALERPDDRPLDEEFGSQFESRVEALTMELGNDSQRRLFRERADAMGTELRGRIQNHTAEQGLRYRQDTLAGTIASGQRGMGTATDPVDIARWGDMTRQAAVMLADLRGVPDEQREDFYREALTPGHLGVISRLTSAEDIDGAESYFNQYRDELDYETTLKIEAQLIEQRAIMEGGEIGEQIAGLAGAANASSAPQDVGMPVVGAYRRTGNFGDDRGDHRHGGVDFAMPVGTPVYAGADGIARVKREPGGFGLYVELTLDNGTKLRMAHLDGVDIEDGQRVAKGQPIARSGNSGRSTGPHLHYEVIGADGAKQDPLTFHQGRPQVSSGAPGATLQDQLQQLYSLNLPPRQEQEAERKIRSVNGARREAETEERDNIISRAFAEIDSSGTMSTSTRAAVVAAGLGSNIPSLRSFEKATKDRRDGATISESDGLIAYGNAREMIAAGQITNVSDLLPLKPYLPDNYFKQLLDDVTASPQAARQQADSIITTMNEEVDGTGLFVDEDGKKTTETRRRYSQFVGAVTRQIEVERAKGPVTPERQREIVLGMIGQQVISATGERTPGFEARRQYDAIPTSSRARVVRALQRQGIPVPSQRQVVSTWLRMQSQ